MELATFLHGLPAFERFSERHLNVLMTNLEIRQFRNGERLVTQDEQGAAMYIIMNGAVGVTRHDPIENVVHEISEAREGEVIGLLSLVDALPSPETCTAHGPVAVAALSRERYHALFLLAPPIARQLQYMVAVQLARDLQEKNKLLRKGLASRKKPSLLERLLGASS